MFRRTRKDNDRQTYVTERKTYKHLLKQKKKLFRKNLAEPLANNISDSAQFWKELKQFGGWRKTGISAEIKSEDWYEHFKNVYSTGERNIEGTVESNSNVKENENHVLNMQISEEEVERAISNLKPRKAPGLDGITSEMLKAGGKTVISFLEKLFNQIFDKGIYPKEWAKAIVIPIFKKGDANNPDNYRGVSLISILCKCYTSILNSRLYQWLEDTHSIAENQAGFRKNHSTVDHIFTLYSVVQKCMHSRRRKLYVAFRDFKKAFDYVHHDKLLETINSAGIKGKFLCSIKAMAILCQNWQ